MESFFSALAFLIESLTIGGIIAVTLAVIGVVPVQIHRYIEIHVSDKEEAARILKSWGLELGGDEEDDDEGEDQ
jgi:hypothetical protein